MLIRGCRLRPNFSRNLEISIPITQAGAFAFYTTYRTLPDFSAASVATPELTRTPTYYIDVAPRLTINGEPIPLDAVSMFSVISKFMGEYPSDWQKHLRGIGQRSYNIIHFTPLMQRGSSNSPYSIYDQLTFDPACFPKGEEDISLLVKRMEQDHGLLGLTDVVWNHTANNSKWLEEHPEAGYSVKTAPWLESALELDDALLQFSQDLAELGLPTQLITIQDLETVMRRIETHVLEKLRLWEYYTIDVERDAEAASGAWTAGDITIPATFKESGSHSLENVKGFPIRQKADYLVADGLHTTLTIRHSRKIDPRVGAALLTALLGQYDGNSISAPDRSAARNELVTILNEINVPLYQEYNADRSVMLEQLFNRLKYLHVDEHGPRVGKISEENPLIESYFTRLPRNSTTRKHDPRSLALVNNGWIWNADAMTDHAGPGTRAYLRREVIVWTDCVKLRYGSSPKDNPFLWDFMARYTRLMAKYFTGFRIDNCHSTPIAVAEHLLDEARKVRPNLLVCAELFTGSESLDYVFVERLGLSSLIREAMQAWSPGELSRLVHRHGGRPIGSFEADLVLSGEQSAALAAEEDGSPVPCKKEAVHHIKQTPVHALFMDCTHDNEVPTQKRDARDTLPNSALVSMCACATGSVMGYDELYPKQIDLVRETRRYTSSASDGIVSRIGDGGLTGIKKLLNEIHTLMGKEGYDETFIHHEGEYITIHRVHPTTRKGYFLIAHTVFPGYEHGSGILSPVHLAGTTAHLVGSWELIVDTSEEAKAAALTDKEYLSGLPNSTVELEAVQLDEKDIETVISVVGDFPPGSIALFETSIPGAEHAVGLENFVTSGAKEAFGKVDLIDLNFILYRCEPEERDSSGGQDGVYNIPQSGPLVYAGLQGWWSVLKGIIRNNDLGHPLCQHLRDGQWALDYIVARMARMSAHERYAGLREPTQWLEERFQAIRKVPSFLLPRYFALVLQTAYSAAWDRGIALMGENVRKGQWFLQSLAMVSVQQTGLTSSASLYPKTTVPCLAAGLPHFASGWARCWGRDVFISLRGLFLGTGRFPEAKDHILAFASVLKHGMIPNLLSDGKLPRYNSRDSIWFFLQSVQDYTKIVPDGLSILQEKVSRRFLPYDDTWFEYDDPRAYSKTSTLGDIIQEALQMHATGLSFREANAGPGIDMQMRDEGFQIDVYVDWQTGLVFGGNQFNCGTWMDKMGENERSGSKGIPGTPRDGAPVEITGLLYSALVWVCELNILDKHEYDGVKTADGEKITFRDWADRIEKSFEECYYVPAALEDDVLYDINSELVNRRGIYKDLYRSGKEYEDYQLRPNFPIAMCVAPQLFDPEKALGALAVADVALRGPTGMATLDPKDLNYRPYYNNSEDSTDFATSKGRNYHQGPEWLWPTGYFLRALLRFDLTRRKTREERVESFQQITQRLEGCKKAIVTSPWAGLAELTNKNGEMCADSVRSDPFRNSRRNAYACPQSPTQAWSAGCLIDLFLDAAELSEVWRSRSGAESGTT
ncbi:MAG: hypothetical protein M1832_006435 [Thelocarpon impressellum]|nr:MAG: hypothetical protein M1832_006435 [Thelocarpon impressellum]